MTKPETELWALLRRKSLNLRFRKQHPMGQYVLDFYCPSAKLCVEVDGPSHDETPVRDHQRDLWLNEKGVRVLRFPAEDVLDPAKVRGVLAEIVRAAAPSTASRRSPSPAIAGEEPG